MQAKGVNERLIAQNQRLIQHLNSGQHTQSEVRQLVSEITGQELDESVEIRLPFYSDYGRNLKIGKQVYINSNVMMVDLGGITIEDQVLIGPGAYLVSVNHQLAADKRHDLDLNPVHIGKNAWLGARSVILPGVHVGENAIVGAGAVVTKNVPANTIVAGVPAKIIRTLASNEEDV
ncbi:DapH/DapD/GlmU-related protein [Pediococcus siamensis]|uniref:DapH/DapD/GlmU-related protein n=1 Tax=Pediococcus siamensis TaxID=381829 RepID=UPI0039A0FC21